MADNLKCLSVEEIRELRKFFFVQAAEILDGIQTAALRIEAGEADEEVLRTLKRQLHTMKGDSASMGFAAMSAFCHRLEDVLSRPGNAEAKGLRHSMDLILRGVDELHRLVDRAEQGEEGEVGADISALLDQTLGGEPAAAAGPAAPSLTEYQVLQAWEAVDHGKKVYQLRLEYHPQCREREVAALMVERAAQEISQVIVGPPVGGKAGSEVLSLVLAADLAPEELRRRLSIPGIVGRIEVAEMRLPNRENAPSREPRPGGDAAPALPSTKGDLLRVESSKVDRLLNLVGELVISRSMIGQLNRDLEAGQSVPDALARIIAFSSALDRTVSDLQKGVMAMRMVPVKQLFKKFPRLVRDLGHILHKEVRLEVSGEATELDKSLVEGLSEPLAHLIRNMLDHGLELPEERLAAGKFPEGVIHLKAHHEASYIVIEVADDGRGIDLEALKRRAVAMGLLEAGQAESMRPSEAINLIFVSGLSTARELSETSGRGIGMDVVRSTVESFKGTVEVESQPGQGTRFRLRLPITLAVVKSLLFEVGERLFAIPVTAVAEVARITTDQLVSMGGQPTLRLRDQIIPVVSLQSVFRIDGNGSARKFLLVVALGEKRVGIVIDRLLWQQDLVVKPLDTRYLTSSLLAGGAILGDGRVVFSVDPLAIYRRLIEDERRKRARA